MALPIWPTKITPTPTIAFSSAAATIKDDVGLYTEVTGTITPAATTAFPIRVSTGGTGRYDFDWIIRDLDASNEFIVQAGATTFSVPILVNENLDTSETYVITLVDNGYTNIGVTNVHTLTCERAAEKPSATNTGHHGFATQTWTGNITSSGTYYGLIFDGQTTIKADDVTLDHCWFKRTVSGDYSVKLDNGRSGLAFIDCELGNDGALGHFSLSYEVFLNYGDYFKDVYFLRCHIHDVGADFLTLNGRGIRLESCYIEKIGANGQYQSGVHGDATQKQSAWILRNFDAYRCFFNLAYSAKPAGYGYNACFQIDGTPDHGLIENFLIRSCWVLGGNTTFQWGTTLPSSVINNRIRNCRIGARKWNGSTGEYNNELITDSSGSVLRSGCIADHDENKDPADYNAIAFNNAEAF